VIKSSFLLEQFFEFGLKDDLDIFAVEIEIKIEIDIRVPLNITIRYNTISSFGE
jgi:hypothetical protein